MMPWIDSGTGSSWPVPCSASIGTYCSAYSGLPPGAGEQRHLLSRFQHRTAAQQADQLSCVIAGQPGQRQRDGVRLAAAPARPPRQQLRPGRANHQQRHLARPIGEVVDEVEQPIVGPVQILEHQHQRPLPGQRLEELPPSGEHLATPLATGRHAAARPSQCTHVPGHPVRLRRARHQARYRLSQLGLRLARGVVLQDARLRLDDLGKRPEADPLAVGERAALPPAEQLGVSIRDP